MGQETITYLTNIVITVILAGLITHYWLRQGRTKAMSYWMLSAWTMVVADVLFAARPDLPYWLGRLAPTLLVTLGHAGLYLGTRITAKQEQPWKLAVALIVIHAAGLVYFLLLEEPSRWRMVFNGVIWAALSLASFWTLRRAPRVFWQPLVSPANVFLLHALFHGARIVLAIVFAVWGWEEASSSLQIVGDLEVSFFMVALFVGLLIANLQQRHEELTCAHAEVATLAGLLPICAWCKKVRDDDGYWRQVEDYFATRSQIQFTHGMCADCFDTQKRLNPKL